MHLYLHVPFCARRCSYCDFAIAVRRDVPSDAYIRVVLREWAGWQGHESWAGTEVVDTIYLGGGTPSLLEPRAIATILDRIAADRRVSATAEVTLEANPDDVSPAQSAAWAAAGVNRVSLGAQSFAPGVLAWMHRTHSASQIETAFDALRAAGIAEVSLDLIFGLPASLGREWRADLDRALGLGPEHLSLYGLTVEDHTPLAKWTARGEVAPVDEERYAAEFLEAHSVLEASGYEHYEVSNYARPGRRARHNGAYWRRASFIGLGPSAHSAWGRQRQWNLREWSAYARAVIAGNNPVAGAERLDDEAVELEELYLGLRTSDGTPADRVPVDSAASWLDSGWAVVRDGRVRLTPEGWLRLDALTAAVTKLNSVPMPPSDQLTERELRVLEAVVQTYIETAEPAGSQTIARRFGLGVSAATIRNTMSDLEDKGFLFHPHTSAGRIPTDRAYRVFVNEIMRLAPPTDEARQTLRSELAGSRNAVEEIVRRAAQVLGVLTQELGVAVAPALDELVLERLELVPVSSERLLLVFNLRSGVLRTIFVEVPARVSAAVVHEVARILNERLAGLTLSRIRESIGERLRDTGRPAEEAELLNIFVAEREEIFDLSNDPGSVVLGSAQMLAEQPEFSSNARMRELLRLTEGRDLLKQALASRRRLGLSITIGSENPDTRLSEFTLVTSSYQAGDLKGVIGVMGPTRMPYDKIIGLVEHTSRMVEGLLE